MKLAIGPIPTGKIHFDRMDARPLKEGDVIRLVDDSPHYVQYVNTSGAYIVPLTAIVREIRGVEVGFAVGGKTISAHSMVEHINPLSLGGNSQEYRRYVRMVAASQSKGAHVAEHGAGFGEFDDSPVAEDGVTVVGHATGGGSAMPDGKEPKVTKKAKANGAAKREKTPKTVRKCACGCKTETTGYFAPGHDARMHGWVKKLADGRMEPKDLPKAVADALQLKQTKSGFQATKPHFWTEA